MGLNGGKDARVQRNDLIYFGVCINNNDPLRAGRIIAVDDVLSTADKGQDTDPVQEAKKRRALQIENKEYVAWDKFDPDVRNKSKY